MTTLQPSQHGSSEVKLLDRVVQAIKARPKLTLTQRGSGFCALTLGVGFVALNSGNNLIYLVLGMMLALILSSGVLSSINLHRVRVKRRDALRGFAGAPIKVKLRLVNLKPRWPSMGIGVEDPPVYKKSGAQKGQVTEGRESRSMYIFRLRALEEESIQYQLTLHRRGRYTLEGARIYTRFPFGFFEKSIGLRLQLNLAIYPRCDVKLPHPIIALTDGSISTDFVESIEASQLRQLNADDQWNSIEAHQIGEPLKHVHWKVSARRGELMAIRGEQKSSAKVRLWVNPHYDHRSPPPSDLEQDAFCDLIMTLIWRSLLKGESVELSGLLNEDILIEPESEERYRVAEHLVDFIATPSMITQTLTIVKTYVVSLTQGLSLLNLSENTLIFTSQHLIDSHNLKPLQDILTPAHQDLNRSSRRPT